MAKIYLLTCKVRPNEYSNIKGFDDEDDNIF